MSSEKPIHTVILDAGPIIRGEPGISSLLQQCEEIVSTPAVIQEIRDETTRARLQTTILPFLTLRSPKPANVKIIEDFARKTGDLAVLSRVDVQLLALSYELECERNGGDWRLRSTPGQKRTNGPPPAPKEVTSIEAESVEKTEGESTNTPEETPAVLDGGPVQNVEQSPAGSISHDLIVEHEITTNTTSNGEAIEKSSEQTETLILVEDTQASTGTVEQTGSHDTLSDLPTAKEKSQSEHPMNEVEALSQKLGETNLSDNTEEDSEISDSEGWITPSNLKKKQVEDARTNKPSKSEPVKMQVATITGDYACQNVLMQMNLNILSPSLQRIRHIRTTILRCHACFNTLRDMSKQFCPRCGKPTLTRVSCTTDANGEFKLHLKKNMQWNHRGDRFSIPKPVAGASNGRVSGGGKGGWGNGLILAEDQKEYVRGNEDGKRIKQRDLMDEDYLPGILTGDRRGGNGKMKVGAGRNVNSKKR